MMKCDLLDFDAVTKLITSLRPHVIVHCAAERRLEVSVGAVFVCCVCARAFICGWLVRGTLTSTCAECGA